MNTSNIFLTSEAGFYSIDKVKFAQGISAFQIVETYENKLCFFIP